MMSGMTINLCEMCQQPLPPDRSALVAIHEAMGVEPFTTSELLASTFAAGTYWPDVINRDSMARSVGRHLMNVPGLQPVGRTRDNVKRWQVDPAFLPVL